MDEQRAVRLGGFVWRCVGGEWRGPALTVAELLAGLSGGERGEAAASRVMATLRPELVSVRPAGYDDREAERLS